MAYTLFGTNDSSTVKLWSKQVTAAERDNLEIKPLMGKDDTSVIHIKSDLEKEKGDKVTFTLRKRLTGDGKTEGQVAEGNGESLSMFNDALFVNELIHNASVAGEDTIDQNRVMFDLREQAKASLGEWWSDRTSISFFNQVCGYTPQTDTRYTGLNAVVGASSGRIIRANSVASDEALTSNDIFTLALIDRAVTLAKIGSNRIRPIKVKGKDKFIVYLHPTQRESLVTNTAKGQWQDIRLAALAGGDASGHDIYNGALGEHNGCILREAQDVTYGVNSSTSTTSVANTRRAVLLGAQAATCAYKRMSNGQQVLWNEETFDHGRRREVSAMKVWGLKKSVFDSADFGTLVMTSYAAD